MTDSYRDAGTPSPLVRGTHEDDGLRPAIPFDAVAAGAPELPAADDGFLSIDAVDLGTAAPGWMVAAARLIRPLSVGALMAIPTVGTAVIGAVAFFDRGRALNMAAASVAFLSGLPIDIVILIGTLATGYGFAKSLERLKGKSA